MNIKLTMVLNRLRQGETVEYKEGGNSMLPIIQSRQPVTLAPVDTAQLEVGDVVLAKVHGRHFMHKISAIQGDRVQISNNRGFVNGWTPRTQVYGIVTAVEGRPLPGAARKVDASRTPLS